MKAYWEMIKEDEEALELAAEIKGYYRRQAEKDYIDREEFLQKLENKKNEQLKV